MIRLYKLLYVLYAIRLLSPSALFHLIASIYRYGINLMALLHFSARNYGEKTALVDGVEPLTYNQLLAQSERLSAVLRGRYGLASGKKAGVICKNHGSLVKSIYAVSSTGADLYLLHAEMSEGHLKQWMESHAFDLLIYDEVLNPLIERSSYPNAKLLSYHDTLPAINNILTADGTEPLQRQRSSAGKLVLLTGGTTGKAKEAVHRPSLFHYLNPFYDFVTRLNILQYRTAYIATPIYHGYGLAVLLLFCAVGKKVVVQRGFDAEQACRLIREYQVEVVTVVPLMLYRMLKVSTEDLKSLACIASGGAELNPKLVKETLSQLGHVLYNLYGTSEAGLTMIATPQDLAYSPYTIGRKIKGVRLKVVDEHKREVLTNKVGQFCIQHKRLLSRKTSWIETGDLGYRDQRDYYFLCGRADSMIVSAGENVYPIEVEQILLMHPQVEDAAVIGIRDEQYGQRLKAIVSLVPGTSATEEELFKWLQTRLARYQMPKTIEFVEHLPYTPLGKRDKKQLQSYQ